MCSGSQKTVHNDGGGRVCIRNINMLRFGMLFANRIRVCQETIVVKILFGEGG